MSLLEESIAWVRANAAELELSDEEMAVWLGDQPDQARCDLVYMLTQNLEIDHGAGQFTQQARWLRTEIRIFGDKSPLELIQEGKLAALISIVEETMMPPEDIETLLAAPSCES